jgi:hypothetical protein
MTDVVAEVLDQDGKAFGKELMSLWPQTPVPLLHKNEDFHLKIGRRRARQPYPSHEIRSQKVTQIRLAGLTETPTAEGR